MSYLELSFVNRDENGFFDIKVNGRSYCRKSFSSLPFGKKSRIIKDGERCQNIHVLSMDLFNVLSEYEVHDFYNYCNSITISFESIENTKAKYEININLRNHDMYLDSKIIFDLESHNEPWSVKSYFESFSSKVSKLSAHEIKNYDPTWRKTGHLNLAGGIGISVKLKNRNEPLSSVYSRFKEILTNIHHEVEAEVKLPENIIEKSIQFEPEYYQAGLGILNFFGTYLKEQYPDEQASVKIEQKDLTVRMVIETKDGKTDIIEKALHEYELIVTGTEPFSKFSNNDKLNLELRSELRIAKARLEDKQDLIGFQSNKLEEQKLQIDKLLNMIGTGLSQPNNLTIDFKPNISQTNDVVINQNISAAIGNLSELISELPSIDESSTRLNQLENSLAEIENDNNPESVRRSPAMSKFRRLFDNMMDTESDLHKAISKAESGWEIAKDLAGKYNKIAEWCGLPTVPNAFIK